MVDATKAVVGLSIGAILIATIGAEAIGLIEVVNTTLWSASTIAVWAILAIIIVVAFVLIVLSYADII